MAKNGKVMKNIVKLPPIAVKFDLGFLDFLLAHLGFRFYTVATLKMLHWCYFRFNKQLESFLLFLGRVRRKTRIGQTSHNAEDCATKSYYSFELFC